MPTKINPSHPKKYHSAETTYRKLVTELGE